MKARLEKQTQSGGERTPPPRLLGMRGGRAATSSHAEKRTV